MKIKFIIMGKLAFLALLVGVSQAARRVDNLSEGLTWDENRHLNNNFLLVPQSCENRMSLTEIAQRETVLVSDEIALSYGMDPTDCPNAVCLNWGTNEEFIDDYFHKYNATMGAMGSWIQQRCQKKEMGWISYHPNPVNLYWVGATGLRNVGVVNRLEKNTQWRKSWLGHKFVAKDAKTGETLKEYTVKYDAINPIGIPTEIPETGKAGNWKQRIDSTRNYEWTRKARQKRSFGLPGFRKTRIPDNVFGSLQAYYYNNKKNKIREEWYEQSKGVYVNWWEIDTFMIYPPWDLKTEWHDLLQPMVEEFCDTKLARTDIYGIREYSYGSQLLEHVDRADTHICSVIMHLDNWGWEHEDTFTWREGAQNEENGWPVEIWDVDGMGVDGEYRGDPFEIFMEPQDMVFYQSATCIHGRYRALQAKGYVNIFGHYRPLDSLTGYKKEL